jgi:hypothetical protein
MTASNQPELVRQEYFQTNPDRIPGLCNFWNEYERLKKTKEHRAYRLYSVHLNRLFVIAHPEVAAMGELRDLPFIDYSQPIDLSAIREKVGSGKY